MLGLIGVKGGGTVSSSLTAVGILSVAFALLVPLMSLAFGFNFGHEEEDLARSQQ
jgi:uncharacterized transporter YbjL